jgi:hypothetical protein
MAHLSYFFQTKSGSLLAKAFFSLSTNKQFFHPPKERSMPHQQTTDHLVNQ